MPFLPVRWPAGIQTGKKKTDEKSDAIALTTVDFAPTVFWESSARGAGHSKQAWAKERGGLENRAYCTKQNKTKDGG